MNKPNFRTMNRFRRFLLKSTRKVSVEWGLVSLAHNLRKYVAKKTKERYKYAQSMAGRDLVSWKASDFVAGGMESERVPTELSKTYPTATVGLSI